MDETDVCARGGLDLPAPFIACLYAIYRKRYSRVGLYAAQQLLHLGLVDGEHTLGGLMLTRKGHQALSQVEDCHGYRKSRREYLASFGTHSVVHSWLIMDNIRNLKEAADALGLEYPDFSVFDCLTPCESFPKVYCNDMEPIPF